MLKDIDETHWQQKEKALPSDIPSTPSDKASPVSAGLGGIFTGPNLIVTEKGMKGGFELEKQAVDNWYSQLLDCAVSIYPCLYTSELLCTDKTMICFT